VIVVTASKARAQTSGGTVDTASRATPLPVITSRAQLIAAIHSADSAGRRAESFALSTRLREGDFNVGDRILVTYEGLGLTKVGDTLTVKTGRILQLGEPMGDMSLQGVLRFEVQDSIAARVAKYMRNEVIHATPLIRLAVSGAVRSPGSQFARSDMLVSEVIARAGGQDQQADPKNIVIKRGPEIRWQPADVTTALTDGLTVDQMQMNSGDEIVVGTKRTHGRLTLILTTIVAPLVSAIVLQQIIHNR
jgi:hypothetical protein